MVEGKADKFFSEFSGGLKVSRKLIKAGLAGGKGFATEKKIRASKKKPKNLLTPWNHPLCCPSR